MQTVIKIGQRWYAVPKNLSLTDRIANKSVVTGNWQQIMQSQITQQLAPHSYRQMLFRASTPTESVYMKLSLLTQADVAIRIATLATAAKSLQEDIHVCAVSVLDHARAHGDTRGIVALMNALPNGQRVKGLAAWFKHFSSEKINLSVDKQTKAWTCELKKERAVEDFKVDEASEIDFGTFTVEVAPQTMTVAQMIKRIEKMSANDEENADGSPKIEPEARALAAELVSFIRTKQVKQAA